MARDFSRLLNPKTIAVVGGGIWCGSVIEQLVKQGFSGLIWPVHPTKTEIGGFSVYKSIEALPTAPDASFLGINREATIVATQLLADRGAGGTVCFASGFGESADGDGLNSKLISAAGDMPLLGPNCYGFINNLDSTSLWPDQHGCEPVETGVAILTQSSNIAINLTMQQRALPIAYMITCGNQAQTQQSEIASYLLDDPRVTAIGFHIEGFGNLSSWQELARKAKAKRIPLIAFKSGKSVEARIATVSHTASLAGEDAGAQAILDRLGIARVDDLATFLETLKLLHVTGPLVSKRISSVSCSGGEASLIADLAMPLGITFPPLSERQSNALGKVLGPKVSLANPLDYHTYIWRDTDAMIEAFCAIIDSDIALTLLIVDFPNSEMCDAKDWQCAIDAALAAKAETGLNLAMVATLPELMPHSVARVLIAGGVVPLNGLTEALSAVVAAQEIGESDLNSDILEADTGEGAIEVLSEFRSKQELEKFGLSIPFGAFVNGSDNIRQAAKTLTGPLVLKGEGFSHKSEADAVVLGLDIEKAVKAAMTMNSSTFLIEEMVQNSVAELLVGVIKDPVHGFVLTVGAGGILTELLEDSVSLLVPASERSIKQALLRLKSFKLLGGYRGAPPADIDSIIQSINAVQNYVIANVGRVLEVEVNPLICTPQSAIAADALIRRYS